MMKRRTFLALGAAAGGMVALGAALFTNGYRSWVLGFLREALPGYSLHPAGLAHFMDEYKSRHSEAMKFQILGAAESVVDARSLLPQKKAEYVEDEERNVLTEFLIGSDFFQDYPHGAKEITYSGRSKVCRSPFAIFD
jgi:hypothetical protein